MKKLNILKIFVIVIVLVNACITPVFSYSTYSLNNFVSKSVYLKNTFNDINEKDWYYSVVSSAFSYDIMSGVGEHKFNPKGTLSCAEAIVIGAKIHSVYKYGYESANTKIEAFNVVNTPWYDKFIKYSKDEGIIDQTFDMILEKPITRAQMVYAWSKILQEKDMISRNTVTSLPDVSGSIYERQIKMFYEAGITQGIDQLGTFNPNKNITRSEATAMFMNLVQADKRNSGRVYANNTSQNALQTLALKRFYNAEVASISINNQIYQDGIIMNPDSLVEIEIDGSNHFFSGTVGKIDNKSFANCSIDILADDILVKSITLNSQSSVKEFAIDTGNVHSIVIIYQAEQGSSSDGYIGIGNFVLKPIDSSPVSDPK